MNRASTLGLLHEYTQEDGLIKHALAVETCMKAYTQIWSEDDEKWGIVGLLHEFDYEMYPNPDQHPEVEAKISKEKGYPPGVIYAFAHMPITLGLNERV